MGGSLQPEAAGGAAAEATAASASKLAAGPVEEVSPSAAIRMEAADGESGANARADDGEADAGTVVLRYRGAVTLRLRDWFLPYGILLTTVALIYLATGRDTTVGRMAMLFGYVSLACTFLPLPTWPAFILAAGADVGLSPLVVATVGAAATATANMHDYYLVTFLYRYNRVKKIRKNRWYRVAARWYNRAPFGTLVAGSFLPIPIDVVRLMAISEGYPRLRFAMGSIVGRWPRYFLIAWLADRFALGWQWALGALGAMAAIGLWQGLPPLLRKMGAWVRARREKTT
jgi:membrane protein YqaA with SNARE-associated domain